MDATDIRKELAEYRMKKYGETLDERVNEYKFMLRNHNYYDERIRSLVHEIGLLEKLMKNGGTTSDQAELDCLRSEYNHCLYCKSQIQSFLTSTSIDSDRKDMILEHHYNKQTRKSLAPVFGIDGSYVGKQATQGIAEMLKHRDVC